MEKQSSQATKKNRKKKEKKKILLLALLVCLAITAICFVISYSYVLRNHSSSAQNKPVVVNTANGIEFIVERGASTDQIAADLKKQGFIRSAGIFKLLSKINGFDGTYQSGTHVIDKSLSDRELMQVLSSVPASREVTIPEGKTFTQIVDLLFEKKIIKNKEQFIKAANTEKFDYDFLKDLPRRDNQLEGYLFPDTYEFDMNASDRDIIIKMLDNFDQKFDKAYRDKIKDLKGKMTLDKVVILASLIEREAKEAEDRYLISGVLYNRLNGRSSSVRKLQVDATIQYVLLKHTGEYKDKLTYADLDIDDPYNTYKNEGLPPGPICCPGEASIKAALNPAESQYLYYVADKDGTHHFSETYQKHLEAIKKYGTGED